MNTSLFLKTVHAPAPLLFSLHVLSSLALPILSPLLCFNQTLPHPALAWFLSQAWRRQGVGRRAAVHQLRMCSNTPSSVKPAHGFCQCWLFPCILLPQHQQPRTAIPPSQLQDTLETLVTCCLLCVCTGLLQTQPHGAFLMLMGIYICRSGNSSNCVYSVQPDRLLEGILNSMSLESKGNVYSVPKVQVNFPLLEEVRACLQHLTCNLVVVLRLSELCSSTKCNFKAQSLGLESPFTPSFPPPCEM